MNCHVVVVLTLLVVVLSVFLGLYLTSSEPATPPEYGDGWWGRGERPEEEEDTSIRQVWISIPDSFIEDLNARLDRRRLFQNLEDSKFNYGFNPLYMQSVVHYWRNNFNWKQQEQVLNTYDHYKTKIEGLDVHFVHVKPKVEDPSKVRPLLMVHGWPGSFYEFYKILPMLTDPLNHGGSEDDVFEVILPSIPGYGFSEAPYKQGFDAIAAARVFDKLMVRLGFEKYYYQGGDWGSLIGYYLSLIQPSHVLGYHSNMPAGQPPYYFVKLAIGSIFPSLVIDDDEYDRVFPLGEKFTQLMAASGYMHLQATKPDTAGYGLTDSPVGLAAYILEKFSGWTNPAYNDLEDGGLEKHFSIDDLLTNVMIYWVNGNIAPSMRFYKESIPKMLSEPANHVVNVPTGIAALKYELGYMPENWARQIYPDLVSYTRMPRGGHFAAMEEPLLLAEDLRQFVRKVEERQ
ncbi:epoxide hydrolase 1-like isoform X2 [Ptychodera flava]